MTKYKECNRKYLIDIYYSLIIKFCIIMKKINVFLMLFAIALSIMVSCKEEPKEQPVLPTPEPPKKEVYQPQHQSTIVDLSSKKTYEYINTPSSQKAKSVVVDYDTKEAYAKPIIIKYSYENGDTYTYTIPKEFGLWENENGRLRVITDDNCTVWLQGQTKKGIFKEFVFYGNPNFNGKKIKPNSYLNLPAGMIQYCK